jgi:hypothetical protein
MRSRRPLGSVSLSERKSAAFLVDEQVRSPYPHEVGTDHRSPEAADQGAAEPGPIGGSSNEQGGEYRAHLGAYFVAHVLAREPLQDLGMEPAIPTSVAAEVDAAVDDLAVRFEGSDAVLFVQAKLHMASGLSQKSSFATEVVAQWMRAITGKNSVRLQDRLLLAANHAHHDLLTLGEALDRRRRLKQQPSAGKPSPGEARALDDLKKLTYGLTEAQRHLLLDVAFIWQKSALKTSYDPCLLAARMLEATVVAKGYGMAAFNHISQEIHRLAVDRSVRVHADWISLIRASHIPLLEEEVRQKALSRSFREQSVQTYRNDLAARGSRLTLSALGAALSDVPLENPGDALRVEDIRGPRDDSRHMPLLIALRRLGRAIVVGLPGSGKSTALVQVGAYAAARDDWPVPIWVQLDLVNREAPGLTLIDTILNQAVKTPALTPAARASVIEYLREELQQGRALLLLDSLDECRAQVPQIVQILASDLRTLHADTEILIATRHSAMQEIRGLGLPLLEIREPADLWQNVKTVVERVAFEAHMSAGDRDGWVRSALGWIKEAGARDRIMHETPLMPILMALLLRKGTVRDDLRARRARVLSQLIDDVVERWEIRVKREGRIHLGSLDGTAASKVLKSSFSIIAKAIDGRGSVCIREAVSEVARMLEIDWQEPRARAEANAEDILRFWDEAGMFELDDLDEVRPRLRLLGEIGVARFATRLHGEALGAWVEERLKDLREPHSLLLAAGLDRHISAALVANACRDRALGKLLVASRAVYEGAEIAPPDLARLVEALAVYLGHSPVKAWGALRALSCMPLTARQHEAVLVEISQNTTFPHPDLARCFLCMKAGRVGPSFVADVACLFRSTTSWEFPPCDESLEALLPLEPFAPLRDVLFEAARRIEATQSAEAELFLKRAGEMSVDTSLSLEIVLDERGHEDAVRRYREPWRKRFAESRLFRGEPGDAFRKLLSIIADVAPRASLGFAQRRRAPELLTFLSSLHVADSIAGQLEDALDKVPGAVKPLLVVLARLGGFELSVLAAEAAEVLSDPSGLLKLENLVFFYYRPAQARKLDQWHSIGDREEARLCLAAMLILDPWVGERALDALESCPDHAELAMELDAAITLSVFSWKERWRLKLGRLLLHHDKLSLRRLRGWSLSESVALRRLAAGAFADLFITQRASLVDLEMSLTDGDALVRRIIYKRLEGHEGVAGVPEGLSLALTTPLKAWECLHCGGQNDLESKTCKKCVISVGLDPTYVAISGEQY